MLLISNNSIKDEEILKLILLFAPPWIIGIIDTISLFFKILWVPFRAEDSTPLTATSVFLISRSGVFFGFFSRRILKSFSIVRSFSLIWIVSEIKDFYYRAKSESKNFKNSELKHFVVRFDKSKKQYFIEYY